jgi:hypothetical protein
MKLKIKLGASPLRGDRAIRSNDFLSAHRQTKNDFRFIPCALLCDRISSWKQNHIFI